MSAKQIIFPLVGIVALAGAAYAGYSYGVKGGTLPFLGGDQAAEVASDAPAADDPIMAKVGDIEIRRSEVVKFAESIPNIPQEQIELILPELVGQVVDLKLITKEATTSGLGNDPEVQKRVSEVKERILVEIFLNRALEEEVTDEAVEKAYQDYLTENPPVREVSARHILVEEEEVGKDLIKQLDEGADFAALAKNLRQSPETDFNFSETSDPLLFAYFRFREKFSKLSDQDFDKSVREEILHLQTAQAFRAEKEEESDIYYGV